jgi:cytochrome P450
MLKNPFRSSLLHRDGIPVLPGAFPLLGHMPMFYLHTPQTLKAAAESLGPLFWVRLIGGAWMLAWTERECFELLKNRVTTSRHLYDGGSAPLLVGDSMLVLDGAPHQHVRSAAKGPFTPRGLSESRIGAMMVEMIDARVRSWKRKREITLLAETQELALNVIFRIMGIPVHDLSEWSRRYREIFLSVLPISTKLPGFPAYRAEMAHRWANQRLSALIAEARLRPDAKDAPQSLLAAMVAGQDEAGKELSDKELLDNLRLLVLAGHETTASTMAWVVISLAQRPDLWEAITEEAEKATSIPTSPSELRAYPVAEGLFREAVRLYPPVSILNRRTTEWMTIHEHRIPPGTLMGACLMLLSQDPELYPDPERFDPARWQGRAATPLETCQFGGGPHFCLGYHLAWMEVVQFSLVLAREMARAGLRPSLGRGPKPRAVYFPVTRPTRRIQVEFS